jgi:hypothetical protein
MAADLRVRIAELKAQRSALPRSERKVISQRLQLVCDMLNWCETRAGYRVG